MSGWKKLFGVTWVPEWSVRGADDPWAHRKGEPRVFALLWCMYLMAAALLTLFAVRSVGPASAEQYRYGGLAMLALSAFGAVGVAPLVRLSQSPPEKPVRAAIIDWLIVITPLNAVVWPMPALTRWPFEVTAALLLMLAAWSFAAAGVVAWGASPARGALGRVIAAGVCLMFLFGAPVMWFVLARGTGGEAPPMSPGVWGFGSPLTAGLAIVNAPSGLTPVMSRAEWWMCALPAGLGVPWIFAARRA